jgi:hypothetical protein
MIVGMKHRNASAVPFGMRMLCASAAYAQSTLSGALRAYPARLITDAQ